jgi:hypothetical protein
MTAGMWNWLGHRPVNSFSFFIWFGPGDKYGLIQAAETETV